MARCQPRPRPHTDEVRETEKRRVGLDKPGASTEKHGPRVGLVRSRDDIMWKYPTCVYLALRTHGLEESVA